MGWGCGYGPKEYFDYNSGETVFPIGRMTDTEKRIISCSSRGGGPIVGGMIVEEPDFGWPQKGEVCHGEYARGQVPHAPGYQQVLALREWFKSQSLASEFSLNKLSAFKDRIPKSLLQDQNSPPKTDRAVRPQKGKFPTNTSLPEDSAQMSIPVLTSGSTVSNGARSERFQDTPVPEYKRQPNICLQLQNRKRSIAHSFAPQSSPTQLSPVSKSQKLSDNIDASGLSTISVVSERRYNDDNLQSVREAAAGMATYTHINPDYGDFSNAQLAPPDYADINRDNYSL